MFKKIWIPALAFFALIALVNPPEASAAVRFGVAIGGPVYAAPAPVYGYPYAGAYVDPYAVPYAYPAYPNAAPAYSYPYGYFGFGGGPRYYGRGYDRGYYRGGYDRGYEHRGYGGYAHGRR